MESVDPVAAENSSVDTCSLRCVMTVQGTQIDEEVFKTLTKKIPKMKRQQQIFDRHHIIL